MLTEKNYVQRALKSYDNPQCISLDEFEADLNRFSLMKRLITRYVENGAALNERLILNHLVICFNVFGSDALSFVLFKIEKEHWGVLFPFLILLERLPDHIQDINFESSDIELNQDVIDILRKL